MKLTKGFWQTYKEVPNDAVVPSHQLMLRAGLIHRSATGLYSDLPMGLRVLQKIEQVVRRELNRIDCYELTLPVVTSAELWKQSGRWATFGNEMLRLTDRSGREFCISPTCEEPIVALFSKTVRSYKQLPVTLYQIRTKFRDEIRPRYGVMRAREFNMKDAYSFHIDPDSLRETYQEIYQAYERIFNSLGLEFIVVEADGGTMVDGDAKTHEFQVLANSGEDRVIRCTSCGYAANIEKAKSKRSNVEFDQSQQELELVSTPGRQTIEAVGEYLKIKPECSLKSLLYSSVSGTGADATEEIALLLLLGDDELNEIKLKALLGGDHIAPLSDGAIEALGLHKGYIGPAQLPESAQSRLRVIFDIAIEKDVSYVVGANQVDYHFRGYVPTRDGEGQWADLRLARSSDRCDSCDHSVEEICGVEVGHIFELGQKYTESMGVTVLNQQGKAVNPYMGCYGLGVGRTMAAAIEQNHDQHGIIWPVEIAPYHLYFALISKSDEINQLGVEIYQQLVDAGVEVLFDDRKAGPGMKFKDADLLGLPLRLVLGERDYKESGKLELRQRKSGQSLEVSPKELLPTIKRLLGELRGE
ncbi:MAG: proline--tRNA ligase [Bdellovibrionales bacterium]|nr:proline--tRNA ligase [Bdellovibrionales bacterium]MBT3525973.1 proline--tRNA ligase [Bdellovibrionales bacterium]